MINPNIKIIEVQDLKYAMETNPQLCLVDVRELEEWNEFHILGAILIPKDTIASCIHLRVTNKNQPVYLYCKAGVRSLYAAESLIDLGYKEVYSVAGGIMKWALSGYPVEQPLKISGTELS